MLASAAFTLRQIVYGACKRRLLELVAPEDYLVSLRNRTWLPHKCTL